MNLSFVSWKYALLMSQCFTSNDKLADIMIETSTLLVESTDSSIEDVCATRLCLALEQSHKHFLTVLHQSLPVPQSNAIAHIPASFDLFCELLSKELVMPWAFAPIRARDQLQIFWKISIVVLSRIFSALSRLRPNQARFLVLSL